MKNLIATLALMLVLPLSLLAQLSIKGTVRDTQDSQALPGANVVLEGTSKAQSTQPDGSFSFTNLEKGYYTIKVSYVGYDTKQIELLLTKDENLEIVLSKAALMTEEVIVSSTRANEKSAIAYTNLDKEAIQKQNLGQDLPFLLNLTPSIVTTSDAGAGVGYTGMRIRGSDASRINVTVNGIPLNEAESHGVFWVNMPDFASSVDNIQIQRGVGTSTNGAAAFGASVNIQTNTLEKEAFGEVTNAVGSYNTFRHTLKVGTGLLNKRWAVDARLSKITSDGYIDRASSDLKSFFASAGYYGDKSIIKLNVFSGKEKTYQAWNGVSADMLKTNRKFNSAGMYTDAQDSIRFYDNETDNYQQDHYQLIYNTSLTPELSLNAALHYTKGRGYYEQYKEDQDFSSYGLKPLTFGADSVLPSGDTIKGTTTVNTTDLIRRRWLDNDFYGATYSLNYNAGKINAILGGGANRYDGAHFGEVIWAQYASQSQPKDKYYDNNALKDDFNFYGKLFYQLTPKLNAFVDLQYRGIIYTFMGYNNDLENVEQTVKLNFFNPKFGATYALNQHNQLYVSYSIGNKEPNRDDYTQSSINSRPKHETLRNIEAGYRVQYDKFSLGANYYMMDYINQLVLTGQVNDVGAYIRTNIQNSYRTGIELEAKAELLEQLHLGINTTLSRNKIRSFTEYVDESAMVNDTLVYLPQQEFTYKDTDIAFSPSVIAGSQLTYIPLKGLEISLLSKYVGDQYLDNTANKERMLKSYFVNDLRLNYSFKAPIVKNINVSLLVNNILNEKYISNGYTFSYVYDNAFTTENYYYPQAGRNFLASLNIKF